MDLKDYHGGMATSIDQKNFVKTALRLPPELHAAVHASAQKAGRSYNAELVFLIERALTLPAAFIPAPSSLGTVDEHGVFTSRGPRELMAALADKLGEAYTLAQIFKEYEAGDSHPPDHSDGGDGWIASRDPEGLSPALPAKQILRSRKPKP